MGLQVPHDSQNGGWQVEHEQSRYPAESMLLAKPKCAGFRECSDAIQVPLVPQDQHENVYLGPGALATNLAAGFAQEVGGGLEISEPIAAESVPKNGCDLHPFPWRRRSNNSVQVVSQAAAGEWSCPMDGSSLNTGMHAASSGSAIMTQQSCEIPDQGGFTYQLQQQMQ